MADELENLTGVVEGITYRNEANGYAVIEVKTGDEFVTVVGVLGDITVGEQIVFQGEWTMHPNFGRQFKSVRLTRSRPADASGMHRFLASGIIKGIGEATATKIVEKFGSSTLPYSGEKPTGWRYGICARREWRDPEFPPQRVCKEGPTDAALPLCFPSAFY